MKKILNYSSILLILVWGIAFLTGCSKDEDTPATPSDEIRMVSKISFDPLETEDDKPWNLESISYTYDTNEKIKTFSIDENVCCPIQYEKNKILIIDPSTENKEWEIDLNTQGYVVQLMSFDDEYEINSFIYNKEGYLLHRIWDDIRTDYTWENGNLIQILEYDPIYGSNDSIQISYTSYLNKINTDIANLPLCEVTEVENDWALLILRLLNLYGKQSKNLIDSIEYPANDNEGKTNLQFIYTMDNEGYPLSYIVKEQSGGKEVLKVNIEYVN